MNCEDLKKQILSMPNEFSESVQTHIQNCPECYEFDAETQRFEAHFHDAVQVAIPPTLSEEALVKSTSKLQSRKIQRISYALAASVMFMVGLSLFSFLQQKPNLETLIMAHIEKEPFALTATMTQTEKDIQNTLATLGIVMKEPFSKVRFLKRCYIGDELVAHFVIDGQQGPVTVLLMPNEHVGAPTVVNSEQLQGLVVPFSQGGSMAIVGFKGEPLKELASKVQSMVEYNI